LVFENYVQNEIDNLESNFEFPKSLTKQQRAIIHKIAEASNLKHFSTGEGDDSFITIERKVSPIKISRRNLVSNALKQASKPTISANDHVSLVINTVKSPKRRGRKPKQALNVASQLTAELQIASESNVVTQQCNLRSRNKNN
jgi:hypothetical protein